MKKALVLQTDFGLGDGAVSAMYGVAYSVSEDLMVADLTHEIPQYDIWEASYRLIQTVAYWPKGTGLCQRGGSGCGFHQKEYCGGDCHGTVYHHPG